MSLLDHGKLEMVTLGLLYKIEADLEGHGALVPDNVRKAIRGRQLACAPEYLVELLTLLEAENTTSRKLLGRIAAVAKAHLQQVGSVVIQDRYIALLKFFKSQKANCDEDNPSNILRREARKLSEKFNHALTINENARADDENKGR